MGTQTAITKKIIQQIVDCILAVKDNQKSLREEVESTCNRNRPVTDYSDTDKGHGRIETRRCHVFEKRIIVDFEGRWKKIQSIIKRHC